MQMGIRALTAGLGLMCFGCSANPNEDPTTPYVTSEIPLRIVSANDGDANQPEGVTRPDSVTVIDLYPDAPPVTRTVSGSVPNTFTGAPSFATASNGRYAVIPNHPWGQREENRQSPNRISVFDLDPNALNTVATLNLPKHAWQTATLADDERVLAISDHMIHLIELNDGMARVAAESEPFPLFFISFAVSPDGRAIVAVAADEIAFSADVELHLFSLDGNRIRHVRRIEIDPDVGTIDQPFAPRFSPDGSRVLVLNGLGLAQRGPQDALLSIDMKRAVPRVTEVIPNVAQGLESIAFHPSGAFAVVTCIDGPFVSHLAVVDLTSSPMRLLSYVPMDVIPQGIEFSPDGKMLFVQVVMADHIDVYTVDGMNLSKHPFVLRTGQGPASMAVMERKSDG